MVAITPYKGTSSAARSYNSREMKVVSAALTKEELLRLEIIRMNRHSTMADLVREALRNLKV